MAQMLFKRIADIREVDSLATRLRRKRVSLFLELLSSLPRPLRVLDVGGTQSFWRMMGFAGGDQIEITLINTTPATEVPTNFQNIVGDARAMTCFENQEFDVVFSNSVIEHVGTFEDQQKMANEIRRVGQRFFVQTPNKYFPLEPHFFFPGFQFLPLPLRIWLVRNFNLGWFEKGYPYEVVKKAIEDIRLLSRKEVAQLFPGANLYEERVAGLTVSFIVYSGWSRGNTLT